MNWRFRLLNTALMAITLSCVMSLYITWVNLGMSAEFMQQWLKAWACAAPAAFVGVLILASPMQKLTQKILGGA